MAVDGVEPGEDLQEARDVFGAAAVNDVQVRGQQRGAAQHARHHADYDELDLVCGEPPKNLSVPRAGH
jgi:hypothetical protein